jgi:hypothetical protein
MHVSTGQVISHTDFIALPASVQQDYVQVDGSPQNLARVSRAVAHYSAITSPDKARRRAANKAARKARRNNRA